MCERFARKTDRKAVRNGVEEELKRVPGIKFVDHATMAAKQGELRACPEKI
jgi:hypothetical protein